MMNKIRENLMYFALSIALVGSIGSLYFSEIMGLVPCSLCWYQRIALYPMIFIFAIGIVKRRADAWLYAAPLIFLGWLVSIYNTLLVYGVIPEAKFVCSAGVSCAKVTWSMYGFINIPFLAFLAFTTLVAMYFISRKKINL
ncbi:MAG: disulfide bond formation protein B [Candidatus Falkowbacteria bacterium]|nr:disulfide bond formation protein B [Candidatus Falkowbacteria bacterium]